MGDRRWTQHFEQLVLLTAEDKHENYTGCLSRCWQRPFCSPVSELWWRISATARPRPPAISVLPDGVHNRLGHRVRRECRGRVRDRVRGPVPDPAETGVHANREEGVQHHTGETVYHQVRGGVSHGVRHGVRVVHGQGVQDRVHDTVGDLHRDRLQDGVQEGVRESLGGNWLRQAVGRGSSTCQNNPYDTCNDVTKRRSKSVPQNNCYDVTKKRSKSVPKKKCEDVAKPFCVTVPNT